MLSSRQLYWYALLALPISVVGLPIYLQMPQFYAEVTGMSLASLGFIMFAMRLLDLAQDPFIGLWSDRWQAKGTSRARQMLIAVPFFLLALIALVMPVQTIAVAWLALSLTVLYTAFSVLTVNYYALGTSLTQDHDQQNRLATWREATVIAGILLGSVIPQVLANSFGKELGYLIFAVGISVITVIVMPLVLRKFKQQASAVDTQDLQSIWKTLPLAWRVTSLRKLFIVYGMNCFANAFSATLILFYVSDVLQAESQSGYFLGTYFLAGIVAMPLWLKLARRYGAETTWIISMILAAIVFFPAAFLDSETAPWFYAVCIISGASLGADMAMPSSLLAQRIGARVRISGAMFGIYNMVYKSALAIAAGVVLPWIDWAGYQAGSSSPQALQAVSLLYGLAPCIIKLAAAAFATHMLYAHKHTGEAA